MIAPETLFPTHSDTAIAVGCYGIFDSSDNKVLTQYAVRIALDKTTDTMLVKIPWNPSTVPQIKKLKDALTASPVAVCGIRFHNLKIIKYCYSGRHGYTATATSIAEIIS